MNESTFNPQEGKDSSTYGGAIEGEESIGGVEQKKDWLEEAIIREALPKSLREPKTTLEFVKQYSIATSTYYETISREVNQKKIIELCFKQAKRRLPEVMDKLGQKAESGNDTSIQQFMEYIMDIKKRLDITSDDKPIQAPIIDVLSNQCDNKDKEAQ